jgi:hypothetical protein
MTTVLIILLVQGVLGAIDTLWHHELGAALPSKPGARHELMLHAARELIYALIFLSLPWVEWRGGWALVLAGLLAIEAVITLADFIEEDRTRRLQPTERVLHTVMAISFGVLATALLPLIVAWVPEPAGFALRPHGWLSIAATALGLGVLAWAVRDALAAAALKRPAPTPALRNPSGRTVLVTGATGFIGAALVDRLIARGDRVILLVRDPLAARARFGAQPMIVEDLTQLPSETHIEAIVNLAGAATAGGLWTRARRRLLLSSRLDTTGAVLKLIQRLHETPRVLVSASAVGIYGDRGDEPLDERSGPNLGFMSELCRRWEDEAWLAEAMDVRVCRLRLGLVLDWSGGILPTLALPAWFGLARSWGVAGSGRRGSRASTPCA